jgi:hypothetical protein
MHTCGSPAVGAGEVLLPLPPLLLLLLLVLQSSSRGLHMRA